MTLTVEKHIQEMLSSHQSPVNIAKVLLEKKSILENTDDFLAVCAFAYQAGLYGLLMKKIISNLEGKRFIPWGCLIEILTKKKLSLSKAEQTLIAQTIIDQKAVKALIGSQSWDKKFPQLQSMKFKEIDRVNKKANFTFMSLMEDLAFIKAQGVLKKEEDILKKLKKVDPENPIVVKKWLDYQERWSRHLLHEKKKVLLSKSKFTRSARAKKEDKEISLLVDAVNERLNAHPEKRYDMALLFSFADYTSCAMQILKDHLDTDSAQWLYLDLLLQSQLYLDGLNFIDILEEQYQADPEKVFDLTYMRAKIYYGIGKKEEAKEILRELSAVRPNYRMTYNLLKQWEQDE